MLAPHPDLLLASDGAVGVWSVSGAEPRTAEGVDEVVHAEEPWRSTQSRCKKAHLVQLKFAFPGFTSCAVARRRRVQRKQKQHQRARGAVDLHGYGTIAEE